MKTISLILLLILCAIRASTATSLDQAHDVNLNAEILIKAYNENEVEANAKYGGHRATIGGVVRKVGVDPDGDPYVELAPSNDSSSGHHIQCKFSERMNAQVARLRKGALIGIHGVVVGIRNGTVIVKECSL